MHIQSLYFVLAQFALTFFYKGKEITSKLTMVTAVCQTFSDRYDMKRVMKGESIHMQTAVNLTVKMKSRTCESLL